MPTSNALKDQTFRIYFCVILTISVSLFHLAFKPFQMAFYSVSDYLFVNIWYLIILSFTSFIYLIILPKFFLDRFESLVDSEKGVLTLFLSYLFSTGILCFVFKVVFGFYEISIERILTGLLALLGFGFFAILLILPFRKVQLIKSPAKDMVLVSKLVGNKKLTDLLFIHSDKNYIVWTFYSDGMIKRIRVRETLTSVEKRLSNLPEIKRSHRAYIVNLSKIKSISKTHSAYCIQLLNIDEHVPLSRNYRDQF